VVDVLVCLESWARQNRRSYRDTWRKKRLCASAPFAKKDAAGGRAIWKDEARRPARVGKVVAADSTRRNVRHRIGGNVRHPATPAFFLCHLAHFPDKRGRMRTLLILRFFPCTILSLAPSTNQA